MQRDLREQIGMEILEKGEAVSQKEAAQAVDIPYTTFNHRKRGRQPKEDSDKKKQRMTPAEETALIDRAFQLKQWGFPPSVYTFRQIGTYIYRQRVPNGTLGSTWLRGFYKRHPNVKTRYCQPLDYVRSVQGNNLPAISEFFQAYNSTVQDYEVLPENTYNVDEIGFIMGFLASEKVIDIVQKPRLNGKLFVSQPGNRELATIVEGISGDGSALEPMIIYKAKDFRQEWFKDLPNVPESILFGKSPNGWTDERIALRWLESNFGPSSTTARKAGTRNRILLFDGHNSHVNINFLEYCVKNRVIPICLPPHTSHRLQPLDVSVFSPYKQAYRRELRSRFENHEVGVSKRNFYQIVSFARTQALTEHNIRSGFWYAGIIPSDGEIILQQLCGEKEAREQGRQTERPSTPPLETRPLCDIELTKVAQLHTPRKPAELKTQAQLILDDLPPTSSQSWRQRHILENILHSAEYGMAENNLKDARIKTLEKEIHDVRNKKKTSRKIIPDQGTCFLSQADIKSFFAHREAEKQRKHQAEIDRLQTKIATVETKIHSLSAKRTRVEELEEGNRRPKRWKTSVQLTEEVLRFEKSLSDAKTKLQQIETVDNGRTEESNSDDDDIGQPVFSEFGES